MSIKNILEREVVLFILFSFFSIVLINNIFSVGEQQYVYLAQAFLQGQLHFLDLPAEKILDAVFIDGKYYWPLAPFPALLLMPFVFAFDRFSLFFYQGYLQFFLTLGIFFFCFTFARGFSYSRRDSLFLAFAFCFASIYQIIAVVPWASFFAHAVCVFLLFLALYEYFTKRRYLFIGILLSLVFATRFTAGLGIAFFILAIITEQQARWQGKIKDLIFLCLPVFFVLSLLLLYNAVRFDDPFDNGYLHANNAFLSDSDRYEQLNHGLFKISNIPTNLYYYFLKGLDAVRIDKETIWGSTYILQPPYITVSYPGVSFFIVSPIFLYLFKLRMKERIIRLSLVTMAIILCFLLPYYWPGWRQVGPRYLLDLLPFAYLVLMYSFKKSRLPGLAKIIIIASALFDLYLLPQVFRMAP